MPLCWIIALACLLWSPQALAADGVARRDWLVPWAETITTAIEAAGIGIIVLSALLATALFFCKGWRSKNWAGAYEQYRANLGRGILLGLELLVAADIIGTVAAPLDLRSIGVLALIVLIRTFLSFSLEVEIKGRWPWQEARRSKASGAGGQDA